MILFTLKIILCDSIPCLEFIHIIHINACTVIKNESQVCSSLFPLLKDFYSEKNGQGTENPIAEVEVGKSGLLWKGVCREREDPEILRTSRRWGGLQRDGPA